LLSIKIKIISVDQNKQKTQTIPKSKHEPQMSTKASTPPPLNRPSPVVGSSFTLTSLSTNEMAAKITELEDIERNK